MHWFSWNTYTDLFLAAATIVCLIVSGAMWAYHGVPEEVVGVVAPASGSGALPPQNKQDITDKLNSIEARLDDAIRRQNEMLEKINKTSEELKANED